MNILLKYGEGNTLNWEDISLNEVTEASLSCIDSANNFIVLRIFPSVAAAEAAKEKLEGLVSKAYEGGTTVIIVIDDL